MKTSLPVVPIMAAAAILLFPVSSSSREPQPGALDLDFAPATTYNGPIHDVARQSDGKWIVGGDFREVPNAARDHIARLHADGEVDESFMDGRQGANGIVDSVAVQADGQIVIAGDFTQVNGHARRRIARLNSDGTLDASFGADLDGADDGIESIVLQGNGGILLAGSFTSIHGEPRNGVARLHPDGTLDKTFGSGLSGAGSDDDWAVHSIVSQSDGKILIGGEFTRVNDVTRNRIARLHHDGTLDRSFGESITGANGAINSIALQADGKVCVGGAFTEFDGVARSRIARLDSNGQLDRTFLENLSGIGRSPIIVLPPIIDWPIFEAGVTEKASFPIDDVVNSIAVQNDQKILIGGSFDLVNGTFRSSMARLHPDGTLDTTFSGSFNGNLWTKPTIFSITIQSDGRIVAAGKWFRSIVRQETDGGQDTSFFNGTTSSTGPLRYVYDLGEGRILVASPSLGLLRSIDVLMHDGTEDAAFLSSTSRTTSVAVQRNGKILAARLASVARLDAEGRSDPYFATDSFMLRCTEFPGHEILLLLVSCFVYQGFSCW